MANKAKIAKLFLQQQAKKNKHTELYKLLSSNKEVSINSNSSQLNTLSLQFFLIKTIVSQQVSTSAAKTIWERMEGIFKTYKGKSITPEILRTAGISERKSLYIMGILNNQSLRSYSKKTLESLPLDDLNKMLIQIKGVGPWTIGITRMFFIQDEDVWLDGDLGINKAIEIFLPRLDSDHINTIYKPYRTYLSLYLWKGLDSI